MSDGSSTGGSRVVARALPATLAPTDAPRRVLLALADPALAELLSVQLRTLGHAATVCRPTDALSARVAAEGTALVVLEATARGLARCAALRQHGRAWILVLGRRPGLREHVAALDAGADGYAPPGSLALAAAAARALLRRAPPCPPEAGPLPVTSEWALDAAAGCLVGLRGDRPLAPLELWVLRALLARPGQVVTRAALLATVWGRAADDGWREVDQYVCALRRKLEPDPAHPRYRLTVRGVGYRYRAPGGDPPGA